MSKSYTLNYFIKFFSNIPSNKWHCGSLTNRYELEDGVCKIPKACALGFAGGWKATLSKEIIDGEVWTEAYENTGTSPEREAALQKFLGGIVASINDASTRTSIYHKLGKTPRTRIIKALKLRKKHGPNWANNL